MTPTQQPARGIFKTTVARQRPLCREHFELTLTAADFPDASPGQFVQVLCHDYDTFDAQAAMLRRPFSIGGLRRLPGRVELDLLGRIVGPGTTWLSRRVTGDVVDVLGPLGRGFSTPRPDQIALLVAGGIGLPPIRWHGQTLQDMGVPAASIFGAQSRDLIPLTLTAAPDHGGEATHCSEEFSRCGIPTAITTDDGSCGLRGRVTDALLPMLRRLARPNDAMVFACGPEPMLRAVGRMCVQAGIACELAMERVMACGMGTCQSCVVAVEDPSRESGWRYALCCTEGPVFESSVVRWE